MPCLFSSLLISTTEMQPLLTLSAYLCFPVVVDGEWSSGIGSAGTGGGGSSSGNAVVVIVVIVAMLVIVVGIVVVVVAAVVAALLIVPMI